MQVSDESVGQTHSVLRGRGHIAWSALFLGNLQGLDGEGFAFTKSHGTSLDLQRMIHVVGLHEQKYGSWTEGGDWVGVPGFSQMSPDS